MFKRERNLQTNFLEEPRRPDGTKGYPIHYPLVFIYAAFKGKLAGMDKQEALSVLTRLKIALDSKAMFKGPLFELFPLFDTPLGLGAFFGFLLVDQTNSCIPLVLYTDAVVRSGRKPRVAALSWSLQLVLDHFDRIWTSLSRLKSTADWNEETQVELCEILRQPSTVCSTPKAA